MKKNFEISLLTPPLSIESLEVTHEPVPFEIASQSFSNEPTAQEFDLNESMLWIDEPVLDFSSSDLSKELETPTLDWVEHDLQFDDTDIFQLLAEDDFNLLCELNSEFDFLSI